MPGTTRSRDAVVEELESDAEQRPIADLVEDFLVEFALNDDAEPYAYGYERQQRERRQQIGKLELTVVSVGNEFRVVRGEEKPHRRSHVNFSVESLRQQVGHDGWRARVRDEAREPGEGRPEDAARP